MLETNPYLVLAVKRRRGDRYPSTSALLTVSEAVRN
jgi:hypothetical protein